MRQYIHGGRGDKGLVHVAALLTDSIIFIQRLTIKSQPKCVER